MMRSITVNAPKRRFSVEEYHRLTQIGMLNEDDKVELIQGEIVKMSPIGPKHAAVLRRMVHLFNVFFGDKYIISPQNPVQLGNDSEPEPDIVLLKKREDFYASAHPSAKDIILLVEIADSTLQYDVEVKLPLYAEAGIAEYWIADLQNQKIIIHTDPEGVVYLNVDTYQKGEHIVSHILSNSFAVVDLLGLDFRS